MHKSRWPFLSAPQAYLAAEEEKLRAAKVQTDVQWTLRLQIFWEMLLNHLFGDRRLQSWEEFSSNN